MLKAVGLPSNHHESSILEAREDSSNSLAFSRLLGLSLLIRPDSYNFVSGGAVVGYGMRNEVGMAFDGNNMYVAPLPISQ